MKGEDTVEKTLLRQELGEDVSSLTTSSYSKKKQVLATIFATLGCLLNGAAIGFTGEGDFNRQMRIERPSVTNCILA